MLVTPGSERAKWHAVKYHLSILDIHSISLDAVE